ncbi:hypothetical protein SDC9_99688 [bioreactor metagenome]|uniref:Uncharacterized protein n=1 Tax=bioreactor metagenome TaxID=1076179 RepID=A0A645ATP2_9ZZZZ
MGGFHYKHGTVERVRLHHNAPAHQMMGFIRKNQHKRGYLHRRRQPGNEPHFVVKRIGHTEPKDAQRRQKHSDLLDIAPEQHPPELCDDALHQGAQRPDGNRNDKGQKRAGPRNLDAGNRVKKQIAKRQQRCQEENILYKFHAHSPPA